VQGVLTLKQSWLPFGRLISTNGEFASVVKKYDPQNEVVLVRRSDHCRTAFCLDHRFNKAMQGVLRLLLVESTSATLIVKPQIFHASEWLNKAKWRNPVIQKQDKLRNEIT